MIADPYVPPKSQPKSIGINKRPATTGIVLAVALAASVAAATATMIRVSTYPFFGPSQYLIQAFPYLLLIVLAIACRRSVLGANISLIGSLLIGGCGVFLIYSAGGEIDTIAFTPFILVAGFFVVLLAQFVRLAIKMK